MITGRQLAAATAALGETFREVYAGAPQTPFEALVTRLTSNTLVEDQGWFGAVPGLTEWLDEINVSGAGAHTFSIRNRDWASSIKVAKNLIADNRLAAATPQVEDLAAKARTWAQPHIWKLILNATSASGPYGACYDGKAFFANDHAEGDSGSQDNLLAGTGITEDKITDDLATGYVTMAAWKDDQGEIGEVFVPDTVVIPPVGGVFKVFRKLSQGVGEQTYGDWRDVLKRVLVNPLLTDANDWYLFSTSSPIRPFIHQVRQEPYTETFTTPLLTYVQLIAKARGAFAYGNWRCGVKFVNS